MMSGLSLKVVLMLAGDLDCGAEGDRQVLERLLALLVGELDAGAAGAEPPVPERTHRRELRLVVMRLLSEYIHCKAIRDK